MFTVIEEPLNLPTLHFSYLTSQQSSELDKIPFFSYDVIVALPGFSEAFSQLPFKYDSIIHEPELQKFYRTLDSFGRIIKKTGTLYIYGLPQMLPYFSVYLNERGWQFKYWLALETNHPAPSQVPMVNSHEGILLYVRDKNKFSLRKARSEHLKCEVCGDFTADWGGKKHLRNPLGYAISDVWDDLPTVKNGQHILSKEVWQRLVLLTANDHSRILCAPYDGVQDLDRSIFE